MNDYSIIIIQILYFKSENFSRIKDYYSFSKNNFTVYPNFLKLYYLIQYYCDINLIS